MGARRILIIIGLLILILYAGVLTGLCNLSNIQTITDQAAEILPTFQSKLDILPTIKSTEINILVVGPTDSVQTAAVVETNIQTVNTEMPPNLQNGQILYLGFDENIYSISPGQSTPVLLGKGADFHVVPGQYWFSQDGRYAVVIDDEQNKAVVVVNTANGDQILKPGNLTMANPNEKGLIQFEFSPDSRRFLFKKQVDTGFEIIVFDLPSGSSRILRSSGPDEVIRDAVFFMNGDLILVSQYDLSANTNRITINEVQANRLPFKENLIEIPNWEIDQLSVSPNSRWISLIMHDSTDDQTVFIVDAREKKYFQVFPEKDSRFFMTYPAWTYDGDYLLINRWNRTTQEYNFISYDPNDQSLSNLVGPKPMKEVGSPLAVVSDFAPDNKAAGVELLYSGENKVEFWITVLDGSYNRKIGEFVNDNGNKTGDYIIGMNPDWTRLLLLEPSQGLPIGRLMAAALDGTNRILLDEEILNLTNSLGIVVSPDGRFCSYMRVDMSKDMDEGELSIIDLDGNDKQVLLKGPLKGGSFPLGFPLVWLPAIP